MTKKGWRMAVIVVVACVIAGVSAAFSASAEAGHQGFLSPPFNETFPVLSWFDHRFPWTSFDPSGNGIVINIFGEEVFTEDSHNGYDWEMPPGTPIFAAADGYVYATGGSCPTGVFLSHPRPEDRLSPEEGWARRNRGLEYVTIYAHLQVPLAVKLSDSVRAGQLLGYSAESNPSCHVFHPHLHFGVSRQVGVSTCDVDPFGWVGSAEVPEDPWENDPRGCPSFYLWRVAPPQPADPRLGRPSPPKSLVAAVLPSSRSVMVGQAATAFATIVNGGSTKGVLCGLGPVNTAGISFWYQATDALTNGPVGQPYEPVDIPPGKGQTFVFSYTPTQQHSPIEVQLTFHCENTDLAPISAGLNTLLVSASLTPVPDIVALAATLNNDGIVNIPGTTGTGVFAVATVNVGAGAVITASADTGETSLPVNILLCQTNPANGVCLATPSSIVTTQINANATPTFGIFVTGTARVFFDPANNRIFVRFKDEGGVTRGATSVAVRTQ